MRAAIVNLNKPSGITSQQAVSRVKRVFGAKKAGHCGTLDPDATGVLVVCLGKATRLADYIQARPKGYRAVMKLGETTDTQDASGIVLERRDTGGVTGAMVCKAAASFVGEIEQVPPMYSALKMGGKPLHLLARKGIVVERAPRRVTIYDLRIEAVDIPFVTFTVECSKGTYIRTICEDMGRALGVGGHMVSLERTMAGGFGVAGARGFDELDESCLIEPEMALSFLPVCGLSGDSARRILHGNQVPADDCAFGLKNETDELFRLHGPDGSFYGIGRLEDGLMAVECLICDVSVLTNQDCVG
ncbi:MAG: tRNA pseudouridine(55) synthase TruB [Nitrospirae bacterium]|nr:tRNA pseudouridine(55) synthase TruB [Nitrospirota bacterium]